MDPLSGGFWTMIGSLWPLYIGMAVLLWFMGSMGGVLGVVAHGLAALAGFGLNFLVRTVALAGAVSLVLIAMLVFHAIHAPDVTKFFPSNATQLSFAAPAPPQATPAPQP